jgi:hypothetical protein
VTGDPIGTSDPTGGGTTVDAEAVFEKVPGEFSGVKIECGQD